MPEMTPGSQSDNSFFKPVTTRAGLITLLSCASQVEHDAACAYLFVISSLKNDESEGGLTDTQAEMVRRWRRGLASNYMEKMRSLAQLSHLLTVLGSVPQIALTLPTSPVTAQATRSIFPLEAFSRSSIDRLLMYELGAFTVMVGDQNASFPASMTMQEIYEAISQALTDLPIAELFVDNPIAQADSLRLLHLGDPLIDIVDRDSARAAIAMIIGKDGEGAWSESNKRYSNLQTICTEYIAAITEAEHAGVPFEPVRPVGMNPGTEMREETAESTHIVDLHSVMVANLFTRTYDIMLLMLLRFFAHTQGADADLEHLAGAILRLMNTVIRPLSEALTQMPANSTSMPGLYAGPPFGASSSIPELKHRILEWKLFDELLWQSTLTATQLCLIPGLPTELHEATAALQDLACQFAPVDGPSGVEARINELKQIQHELDCSIQSSLNGPYLVTNATTLLTWLGEHVPTRPQMALCRCGGSSIKPFCDGTHARNGFTSKKDPNRVPDKRDKYVGMTLTVLDNRGICAHSGFCTDQLSSAFHLREEPFITPNGARMDELIRAIRACPSGALSYAVNDVEVRAGVDQTRSPAIEVSKDGPYRITGGIPLKDVHGNDEPRNAGASLEHYSLCRCGQSQNKPFCSGMHWYVNFHDPVIDQDREPTLFEWLGGFPALLRMTRIFYSKYVPQDPLLQPIFAHMAADHPERVAAWLGEVFGGPKTYTKEYGGYTRMLSQHMGKGLTEEHRARWASLMYQAANDAGLPNDAEFRSAFVSYIEWGSRLAVENSTPGARPPLQMPLPRWDWGTAGPPGIRVSALGSAEDTEEEPALPSTDETVHFILHIKPLFRRKDRSSMIWAFDLWEYTDVVRHAEGILQRLHSGTMPCDGAWSPEKIEVFQRWISSGMRE